MTDENPPSPEPKPDRRLALFAEFNGQRMTLQSDNLARDLRQGAMIEEGLIIRESQHGLHDAHHNIVDLPVDLFSACALLIEKVNRHRVAISDVIIDPTMFRCFWILRQRYPDYVDLCADGNYACLTYTPPPQASNRIDYTLLGVN